MNQILYAIAKYYICLIIFLGGIGRAVITCFYFPCTAQTLSCYALRGIYRSGVPRIGTDGHKGPLDLQSKGQNRVLAFILSLASQ